ncbi:MAG: hypothetical protein D8M51_01575 [Ignavibacteriae bacterium]|nr:hypothetical protein [Ignavibacteriota bacterium]
MNFSFSLNHQVSLIKYIFLVKIRMIFYNNCILNYPIKQPKAGKQKSFPYFYISDFEKFPL